MPNAPQTTRARLRSLRKRLLDTDDAEEFAELLRGPVRDALPTDDHSLLDRIWWVISGGLHEGSFPPDPRWAVLLAVASEEWTSDFTPPTDADEWHELRGGLWSSLDECPLVPPFYSCDFAQAAFTEWLGPEPEEADEDEPEALAGAAAPDGAAPPEVRVEPQLTALEQSMRDAEQAFADLLGPDWRSLPSEPPGTEGMTMAQELDALGL